jgi:hypothetical protein
MGRFFQLSCKIYGALTICYPSELRHRFDEEMAQVFEDQLRERWERRGVLGVVHVWRTALWELLSVALVLRLQNPFVIAVALSLLGSAALCAAFFRAVWLR